LSEKDNFWNALRMPHDLDRHCVNCAVPPLAENGISTGYYGCVISESCTAPHRCVLHPTETVLTNDKNNIISSVEEYIEYQLAAWEETVKTFPSKKPPGTIPFENYWEWNGDDD